VEKAGEDEELGCRRGMSCSRQARFLGWQEVDLLEAEKGVEWKDRMSWPVSRCLSHHCGSGCRCGQECGFGSSRVRVRAVSGALVRKHSVSWNPREEAKRTDASLIELGARV
jgi:hypothetical protein